MLPQHSISTIERVLKEKKGVVDAALTVLLDLPPESSQAGPNSYSQPPAPSPKPKNKEHKHHSKRKAPVHIFPADFLRWPPNAQVVKESFDTGAPTITSEPEFVYQPPPPADYQADSFEAFSNTPTVGKKKSKSGWKRFKDRFKNGKQYSQI
ncbi:hypothetical protein TRFO_23704 [Tritrichomonas foetus]|uniref:CUE domain-containing protein n=1 Tax=Tritrichomonas foetus TaxID=1144522 RepID=A0A1J4K9S9_9EUKA|nr:hypothetical protein TRFO_23704 [Tritrichomonas foetus]|eukprot:OHT07995.1 hypothetical protein TRFO_23704 [Tritrichomonas foetus]